MWQVPWPGTWGHSGSPTWGTSTSHSALLITRTGDTYSKTDVGDEVTHIHCWKGILALILSSAIIWAMMNFLVLDYVANKNKRYISICQINTPKSAMWRFMSSGPMCHPLWGLSQFSQAELLPHPRFPPDLLGCIIMTWFLFSLLVEPWAPSGQGFCLTQLYLQHLRHCLASSSRRDQMMARRKVTCGPNRNIN